MSPARRSHARRDWPRGLYSPRPGYYVWRSLAGKTYALGTIPLPAAKAEANAANAHEAMLKPTLVERLSGAARTVADLLDKMPPGKSANTIKSQKTQDKRIRAAIGALPCSQLTVSACADLIESIEEEGKHRTAEAVRARLMAMCKRGQRLGWLNSNPAAVTGVSDYAVKRGRLTMESFQAIYDAAPQVADWLQRAMMFGLVLGADRLTITQLKRSHVFGGLLTFRRQKTDTIIAVPLALRLNVVNVSLADLVKTASPVVSEYLLHHQHSQGQARAGNPIHRDTISRAFNDARRLAGIPDTGAPTFHELRSLSKREYDKQGNVDTLALLGHAGERAGEIYADPRGVEAVLVKVG